MAMIPREYQQKIFETCRDKNCLVVLPTGTGKTLIAFLLAVDRLEKYPLSKILFLAPTRPLALQHLEYFKKNLATEFDMQSIKLFTGKLNASARKKAWDSAKIIFSTPQCIANDLEQKLYSLKNTSLLVEDECHRCLKNYDYTKVAKSYSEQAEFKRVLGLTASPGVEKQLIQQICMNLGIEAVEVRTRDSEDIKQYLQEMKYEKVMVDFPDEFARIKSFLQKMYERKVEELYSRKLLFTRANKIILLEAQKRIMGSIASGNTNFNMLLGASACAQAIKLSHAIELIETQTLHTFSNYIRELASQGEKKKNKAAEKIAKSKEFIDALALSEALLSNNIEHPKLAKLKEIVIEERLKNPRAKFIIFSQFRDTVTRICRELNSLPGANAKVFVGQAKKGETGLSQSEQAELVREFSLGKVNILCATSIGEEGLDMPEVNAVVFYEPVPSAIRKIQRAGRTARLMEGKTIILVTRGTRDEAYYYAALQKEKKMYRSVSSVQEDLKNNPDSLKISQGPEQKQIGDFNSKPAK